MKPRKPGRRVDQKGRSKGAEPFVRLTRFMLASVAWQSLNTVERALLVEVLQRWNGYNNGSIGLGVIEAGRSLNVRPQTAGVAFHELVDRGFLRVMRDSKFDQKKTNPRMARYLPGRGAVGFADITRDPRLHAVETDPRRGRARARSKKKAMCG